MPSPYPGMDPHLEAPDIWPDFHQALAAQIRGALNQSLPAPYYARLEMRPEIGIVEEGRGLMRIVPDVAVARRERQVPDRGGVAVADGPRVAVSPSFHVVVRTDPIRHAFVEIRDPSRAHKLITLIEILSPSNKRRGPDRQAYERKQREILDSDASLVEIDLLRAGERILPGLELTRLVAEMEPAPRYLVLVSRASGRGPEGVGCEVFPAGLREWLPCIPVPLREGEPDVPLDIQFVVRKAYEDGPYDRGAVDYDAPANPPLEGDDVAWAGALLEARRGRA